MNKISTVCVSMILSLVSAPAFAGGEMSSPEVVATSPEQAACIAACMDESGCCEKVSELEARVAKLEARRAAARKGSGKPAVDRVKALRDELKALIATKADAAAVEALAEQLKEESDKLTAAAASIVVIESELHVAVADLNALKAQVQNHETRITKLEKAKAPEAKSQDYIRIGAEAGYLALAAGSGTTYGGFPVTAHLTFPLGEGVRLLAGGGAVLNTEAASLGTTARAVAQIDLFKGLALEAGVGSVMAGFNEYNEAALVTAHGDLGLAGKVGILTVRGSVLPGVTFEPNTVSGSFGGMLTVGIESK